LHNDLGEVLGGMNNMQLQSKVAIVTGGTKGLGRGIAKVFLEEGAKVVCAGRQKYDFDEFTAPYADRVLFCEVDVRDPESVKALVEKSIEHFGQVDIMVANAGIIRDNTLVKMTYEEWKDVVDTNLNGVFNCTKQVIDHMIERGDGCIINVSSAAATRVNVGQSNYCSSKAGTEMFTRVAAIELGPKGIRVNCLSPGVIDDGMGTGLSKNEKIWERYVKRMALRRPGHSDEIGRAALFLASSDSSYVNGHVLEVNGGLLWG
jgi:3-oxoacyl-[acyl-carrier protein] reductase